MKRSSWLLLQHVDFEGPGAWQEDLARRGIDLAPSRLWTDDPLPDPSEIGEGRTYAGVLAMGGPMDADADDEYPRLAAERALLADVARRQVPVIGVCLGSQLLAVGLGAELRHGSSPEFGLGSVDPADGSAGMSSLAKAFVEAGVLHWHSDAHGLPAGAQLLASTPATPVQAFVLGRAVGMQFHIEIRPEDLVSAAPHLPPELKIDEDELQAAQRGWAEARAVLLDLIGC